MRIRSRTAVMAAFAATLLVGTSAHALNTGTDLNLSLKPGAAGMAGAAYARPESASAAVFGNPATMTQFSGTSISLFAALLVPPVDVDQAGAAGRVTSESGTNPYIIPDVGPVYEVGNGWFVGGGSRPTPVSAPTITTTPSPYPR